MRKRRRKFIWFAVLFLIAGFFLFVFNHTYGVSVEINTRTGELRATRLKYGFIKSVSKHSALELSKWVGDRSAREEKWIRVKRIQVHLLQSFIYDRVHELMREHEFEMTYGHNDKNYDVEGTMAVYCDGILDCLAEGVSLGDIVVIQRLSWEEFDRFTYEHTENKIDPDDFSRAWENGRKRVIGKLPIRKIGSSR